MVNDKRGRYTDGIKYVKPVREIKRKHFLKTKLKSKKNNVYLVQDEMPAFRANMEENREGHLDEIRPVIEKYFTDENRWQMETEIHKILWENSVPVPLKLSELQYHQRKAESMEEAQAKVGQADDAQVEVGQLDDFDREELRWGVRYEYIEGETALEKMEKMELLPFGSKEWSIEKERLINGLSSWMIHFYQVLWEKAHKKWILGDIHLRNFIFSWNENQVYGIDFEECREGSWETDVARLSVFIINYDPSHTKSKLEIAKCLQDNMVEKLKLDKEFLLQEVERESRELRRRRSILLNESQSFK